jgi:hypothetical protein
MYKKHARKRAKSGKLGAYSLLNLLISSGKNNAGKVKSGKFRDIEMLPW